MYAETAGWLLQPAGSDDSRVTESLAGMGFVDPSTAMADWRGLVELAGGSVLSVGLLESLLGTMGQTAAPDLSLRNLRRCLSQWGDTPGWLAYLEARPRAVEILVRLFANSEFLTGLLLKRPDCLKRLAESKSLAEVRSRDEFLADMNEAASADDSGGIDAVRRIQRWELLRIAACDCFGLMDLRRVTLQLSLLADATIQAVLGLVGNESADVSALAVIALGKLGGEELNYSSDVDLLLLSERQSVETLRIGQQLVRELGRMTAEGFLYRVDMRLRPWGRSGPLVAEVGAYGDYLETHAAPWELQALVKARVVAGNDQLGNRVLEDVTRLLRERGAVAGGGETVREMKRRIEAELPRDVRKHGEVKSGVGSIRDIEFVTQFLQLQHVEQHPEILGANTLRSLAALAAAGCLRADEYRKLSSGYLLLRSIEHSLQLMHNKQVHTLPGDEGELSYLARRLDFADAEQFATHYVGHCREIREVFDRILGGPVEEALVGQPEAFSEPLYLEVFSAEQRSRHQMLLEELDRFGTVMVEPVRLEAGRAELTLVSFDSRELLVAICGLLVVHGVDIVSGHAFTQDAPGGRSRCVDTFEVRVPVEADWDLLWSQYHCDLVEFVEETAAGHGEDVLARLTDRVARHVTAVEDPGGRLLPVEIVVDNDVSGSATVLTIQADDTVGFLYECAHALSLAGIEIRRLVVATEGNRVRDRLHVVDVSGNKLTDPGRVRELQTVVVLIKHFTHLLPKSPNPLSALRQFRELLSDLFQQEDWAAQVTSLEKPEVLATLARVLGVSEFLWQDVLRLQQQTLFPLVTDVELIQRPRERSELLRELSNEIDGCCDWEARVASLNAFKDREMFVADMRHIVWPDREFGQFSHELGDVADCVVARALEICCQDVAAKMGILPPGRVSIVGLGKFGGQELGFASDIELVCVYDTQADEKTDVSAVAEFYRRVVERLLGAIRSHRAGVFEIDLRLRPHGQAGPLASSLQAFASYYRDDGPAWPFERQALVKLRAVAGSESLGAELEMLRDRWLYSDGAFDVAAMRAMRDRQVRQLVPAGSLNAKLSPGGLVDSEYLVQGWQLEHGHRFSGVRTTNTLQAIDSLHDAGVLNHQVWSSLREAYVFQRRLIDSLRVVRGDARDLTVPDRDTAEFMFLARRLDIDGGPDGLARAIDENVGLVENLAAERDSAVG
ncbi:MAG: glutamine synthetase adenylyltransferase [Planctomycetota bacterium]|nr:glutamine synthetase adenylyltransferase [Planctomycetota bacterium]